MLLSILALVFLVVLGLLAQASSRFYGARTPEGRLSAPGCVGGCAMFVVLAGLGIAGLVTFIVGAAATRDPREFREAARELRGELRKEVGEWRRELERDAERGGSRARKSTPDSEASESAPASPPAPSPAAAPWRARVTLRWSGHSEPSPELMQALRAAGLGDNVLLEVEYGASDSGDSRSTATLHASAEAPDVDTLRLRLRRALDDASRRQQRDYALLEVAAEELR